MKKTPPKRARARKANPADEAAAIAAAADLAGDFHGRQEGRVRVYAEPENVYPALAGLGALVSLTIELYGQYFKIPFSKAGVKLACTPDGRNLHFVGGDQEIDLASLYIETDKDQIDLGPVSHIVYHTKKGFHDFAPVDYVHQFGEESGEEDRPTLGYSPLNKKIYLSGGAYSVRPEGIVN